MASEAGGTGGDAGGGGGGKTPRKRWHQRSILPYRPGRQRPQSILSRVTESLNNIVPRWLQTYFSSDEDACSCLTDSSEAPQQPENEKDDLPINSDDIHDGRITPQATVSNREDSSKDISAPHLQSVETESCHSLSQDTAISCKEQTLNVSVSGTHSSALVKSEEEAQQLNEQSCFVTRSTARRILQCLEKMSTPLSDARKIPCAFTSPLNYTENEENTTPGQNRGHQESGVSHPDFSMSAATGLPSEVVRGGGNIRRERTCLLAIKPSQKGPVPVQMRAKQPKTQTWGVTSIRARRTSQCLEMLSSSLLQVVISTPPCVVSSPLKSHPDRSEIHNTTELGAKRQKVEMTSSNNTDHSEIMVSSPVVKRTETDVRPSSSVTKTAEFFGSSSISESIANSSAQDVTVLKSTSCKKQPGEDCESPVRPAVILKEGSALDVLKKPDYIAPKTDYLDAQPTTAALVVHRGPGINNFPSSGIRISERSKATSSSQCDNRLLKNKDGDQKCAVHQATKLPPSDTAKHTRIGTPSKSGRTTLPALRTGFQGKCKLAVENWNCDTCLVQNKPEARRCVACETPKRGICFKQILTLPVCSQRAVAMTASPSGCAVTNGALGSGNKLERLMGYWQCTLCSNFNKAEEKKCDTCILEKPAANRASGSTLDSSNSLSWAPAAAAVPGQDTAVSSSALINSAGPRTAQPSAPSHVTTPVTTSNTGKAVTPFVFSSGDSTINTAMFANNLGATTIPGANVLQFLTDAGSLPPSFAVNQTPAFGQSQGASQHNPQGLGPPSSVTVLYCNGRQSAPPDSGAVSSSSLPLGFGQQPVQCALGSLPAANSREPGLDPSIKGSQH